MKKFFKYFLIIFLFLNSPVFSQEKDSTETYVKLNLRNKENIDTNNFNIFPKNFNKKKIALVLSGGGARGLSQIGVLKELELAKIQFDMVIGTSIGAIIGGLYSSGYTPKELDSITKSIDWENKLSLSNKNQREFLYPEQKKVQDKGLITISMDGLKPVVPTSLSSGYQIAEMFNVLLINARFRPKKDFSSLRIPFSAVATDLDKGDRVILNKGSISECIKASFTFPLLYSPTIINGKNLVDGGLTSNIPVDVALEQGADIVIAINSTSPLKSINELKNPLNTADQVISITMAQLNEIQIQKANFVITPDIGNHTASDFNNIDLLLKKGELSVKNNKDKIKQIIDSAEFSSSEYANNFVINPQIIINSVLINDSLKNSVIFNQSQNILRYISIEKQIKSFYELGYFSDVFATIKRDETGTKVIYNFSNNAELKKINVVNNLSFCSVLISDFEKRNQNKIINTTDIYNFYFELLGLIKQHNLSSVDIVKFYFDYRTNELNIKFSNGIINKIKITGNNRINNSVILKEVNFKENNRVLKQEVEKSINNIYSTNLFEQLSIDFDTLNEDENQNIHIHIIEKSSKNIRFSLRADNERKLQLFFDIRNESLFGTSNEAGISISGGLRDGEYKCELKSNRFFNTIFTYNLAVYYKFRNIYNYLQVIDDDNSNYTRYQLGEYKDIKFGSSFLVGTQIEKIGTIYGQLFFENNIRQQVSGDIIPEADFKSIKFKFGGKIDTQNKYPFPTKGSSINYYYETSQKLVSGNISYSKFLFDFEHYFSIGSYNTLKPRFIFGFADKTTPLMEQFSLGGENSFYGMYEDELRGRQVLSASLEYRFLIPFKLFFDTYLSFRYNIGQMWENAEDIRFKDLRHGIGFSTMFDTPIGKASFSAGKSFLLNKSIKENPFVFGPWTFYFGIGYDL